MAAPTSSRNRTAVGQSGQAVVEGLVLDRLVQAGVLQGHGALAGQEHRQLQVARAERPAQGDIISSVPIEVPAATSGTIAMLRMPIDCR